MVELDEVAKQHREPDGIAQVGAMPAALDEDHPGVVTDRLGQAPPVVLGREAIVGALNDQYGLVDALAHRAVGVEVARTIGFSGGSKDLHRRAVPPADAVFDRLGRVRLAEGSGHERPEKSLEVAGGERRGHFAGRVLDKVRTRPDEGDGLDAFRVVRRQQQRPMRPSGRRHRCGAVDCDGVEHRQRVPHVRLRGVRIRA